ncbi:MAG: metallophosphoesterase [Anaerolineae bacterium]|nr:metallophosphoesterase [Anaerolineae bacterium]
MLGIALGRFGGKLSAGLLLIVLLWCSQHVSAVSAVAPDWTEQAARSDFSIVVLPDTQNYAQSYPHIFEAQTRWIVQQRTIHNIAYVAHVGDIVNSASATRQWENASAAMAILEDPFTTNLPDGIPYGILPGNHDFPTENYNRYFGVQRFSGRGYYGGHYGEDNNNNYGLFSAGGMDFIMINLQYRPGNDILAWADTLLKTYPERRAIVVSHEILGADASFTFLGQAIYRALRDNPNLFLLLCGHVHTEAWRMDMYDGRVIYTLLADYQDEPNGGNGWLRILRFSPNQDTIQVMTYSPTLDRYQTDTDSQFTLAYDMAPRSASPPAVLRAYLANPLP